MRCSNLLARGYRCKRETTGGLKMCERCRKKSALKSKRWRDRRPYGSCHRCATGRALKGLNVCAACRSDSRRDKLPGVPFDTVAHQEALSACHDWTSRCAITGRSVFALRKVGERLSIDRIRPDLGYVPGNIQLIALSLNVAKGNRKEVPQWAVNRLLRKLERVVRDRLSEPGAIQKI